MIFFFFSAFSCATKEFIKPPRCTFPCRTCESAEKCTSCNSGFYLDSFEKACKNCQLRIEGCMICSNRSICEKCFSDFSHDDITGKCTPLINSKNRHERTEAVLKKMGNNNMKQNGKEKTKKYFPFLFHQKKLNNPLDLTDLSTNNKRFEPKRFNKNYSCTVDCQNCSNNVCLDFANLTNNCHIKNCALCSFVNNSDGLLNKHKNLTRNNGITEICIDCNSRFLLEKRSNKCVPIIKKSHNDEPNTDHELIDLKSKIQAKINDNIKNNDNGNNSQNNIDKANDKTNDKTNDKNDENRFLASLCDDGEYYNQATQECNPCNKACKTCQNSESPFDCIECADGYIKKTDSGTSQTFCTNCKSDYTHCLICENRTINKVVTEICTKCFSGYYFSSTTKTCSLCDSACSGCSGPGVYSCYGCSTGYVKVYREDDGMPYCTKCSTSSSSNTHCEKCSQSICSQCERNYLLDRGSCKRCDSHCSGCTGLTEDDCIECATEYYKHVDLNNKTYCNHCPFDRCKECPSMFEGCFKCEDFFFSDSAGVCKRCHESCLTCHGVGYDKCEACAQGFNQVLTPDGRYVCTTCHKSSNCEYCNPKNGECLVCSYGYYMNFTVDGLGVCRKCNEACAACSGPTQFNCLKCANGYNFDPMNSYCSNCSTLSNCHLCKDDPDFCLSCDSDFYLSNGRCLECNPICNECTGPTISDCVLCDEGYYKDGSGTCSRCPGDQCTKCGIGGVCQSCISGYYIETIANSNQKVLNTFDKTIEKAVKNTLGKAGEKIFDGKKVVNKVLGNGEKTVLATQCTKCDPSCKACTGSSNKKCTECNEGYSGEATDGVDTIECLPCNIAGCAICSSVSTTTCEKCLSGYYQPETFGQCIRCNPACKTCSNGDSIYDCTRCNDGFSQETDQHNRKYCSNCTEEQHCKICTNSTTCIDCDEGFFLSNDGPVCVTCHPFCKTCKGTSYFNCTECKDGFVFRTNSDGQSFCTKCNEDVQYCEECKYGSTTECKICEKKYFLDSNAACQLCSSSCLTCKGSESNCSSCTDELELKKSSQKDNYICSSCQIANCAVCADGTKCTECGFGFYLAPNRNTESNESSQCVKCDNSCLGCTGSTSFNCLECNNMYTNVTDDGVTYFCYLCNVENCQICSKTDNNICDQCNQGFSLSSNKKECIWNGDQPTNGGNNQGDDKDQTNKTGIIVGIVCGVIVVIVAIVAVVIVVVKKKKDKFKSGSDAELYESKQNDDVAFTLDDERNDTQTQPGKILNDPFKYDYDEVDYTKKNK